MKRALTTFFLFLSVILASAMEKEYIWPKGKMPDTQDHQIAAMTDEAWTEGFKAGKHRIPYLEWSDAPENPNGACMILISGGGYECTCDVDLVKMWDKEFTKLGFQCVNFVYRTPRPEALPIYMTAWEDGQRAVRLVRSQAAKRGFDPEKIGTISMSAGSHLALLLATSSETNAYEAIDKIDALPSHINWAIVNAPGYATTDGELGTPATREGYGLDVSLSDVFKFDSHTCPMCLTHGGLDPYTPNASTLVYHKLRTMGVPAEVHLYPDKPHGAFGFERTVEFLRQLGYLGELGPEVQLYSRFPDDSARAEYIKEDIWPEGKMPDYRESQCLPYLEWHIPENRTTDAIQIIYSGGSYMGNSPDSWEVAPARRFLNEKGVTVVTVKYRTPRPEGLAKHTTAWQDLQRAIRIVRSEAPARGLNPDKIGIMGSSAGGHLTVMGVTSSLHNSYWPIDDIDQVSCSVQWGIGIYPAYILTDGAGDPNIHKGNNPEDIIVPEFSFDLKTCPMLFLHGNDDVYSPMGSIRLWEKMRAMGVQSEVHILVGRNHCFQEKAAPGTSSYNYVERLWDFLEPRL